MPATTPAAECSAHNRATSLPTVHDLAVELDEAFMEAWARHLPALPPGYEDCWMWADTWSRKDRVAAVLAVLKERAVEGQR